jgi:hypothetical protein
MIPFIVIWLHIEELCHHSGWFSLIYAKEKNRFISKADSSLLLNNKSKI